MGKLVRFETEAERGVGRERLAEGRLANEGGRSRVRSGGEAEAKPVRRGDKRQLNRDDYVRGQQVLANAIFHWKNDAEPDARAGVKFLLHHLATAFRADDTPLHPKPVMPEN